MTPAEKILREGLSGLQNGNLTKQQIFRLARETMAKADDAGDGWIPLNMGKLPAGFKCDLWLPGYGRLPDYILKKDYGGKSGNNFFSPIHSGLGCVRDATHYREIPEPPK